MAAESGLSKSRVGRIWKAFGLKPHQIDTFKISNDPQFIDKVRDVVGLYLDPRAPRGADVSSGGELRRRTCRSRDGEAGGSLSREGWEQPRQSRDASALPDDVGSASVTKRSTRETSVSTSLQR